MAVPITFSGRVAEAVLNAAAARRASLSSAITTCNSALAAVIDAYAGNATATARLKASVEGKLEDLCREIAVNLP